MDIDIAKLILERGSFFHHQSYDVSEVISRNNVHGLLARSAVERDNDEQARRKNSKTSGEIARMTMPKLYTPPQDRHDVSADKYEGNVKIFNDLSDPVKAPSFSKITANIAMKEESEEKKLTVCCECTDGCMSKECPCRKKSSDNVEVLISGRIRVKDLNGKLDDEKGESGYLNHHLYTCSDACGCNPRVCSNRISWEEREGEFEILRRNPRMGFEVRSLRTFEQGEVVVEFIGEFMKNLKDKKAIEYSFIVYDGNDIHKSERRFRIEGLKDELKEDVYYLNPMIHGSIARFIAHSRMMNLIPLRFYSHGSFIGQPRIVFVAALTIAYGDFLKVDYGEYYHQCILHPYRNSGIAKECGCGEILCHNSTVLSLIGSKSKSFAVHLLLERELANQRRIWTMEMNCFRSIASNISNYTKSLLRNITNVDEQENIKKKIAFLVKYYREHEEEFRAEMAKDEVAEKWRREMGEKSNDENDDIEEQERLEKKRKREKKIEIEERIGIENLEEWKRKSERMRRKLKKNEFDDDEERKDLKRRLKARRIIFEENNNDEEEKRRNRVEFITID